jgi:hypothetical protein
VCEDDCGDICEDNCEGAACEDVCEDVCEVVCGDASEDDCDRGSRSSVQPGPGVISLRGRGGGDSRLIFGDALRRTAEVLARALVVVCRPILQEGMWAGNKVVFVYR